MAEFTDHVLGHVLAWRAAGRPTALVTLVGIEGGSPRPLGSQMAITIDGEAAGQITGGCAEAALVDETREALKRGENRRLRYGRGSPFFDIQLPCGSGIDVYIDVRIATDLLDEAERALASRTSVDLVLDLEAETAELRIPGEGDPAGARREASRFVRPYLPRRRLILAGRGPALVSAARIAAEVGIEVIAASPETHTLAQIGRPSVRTLHLSHPDDLVLDEVDPYTAAALLFHEHEWEPPILARLLSSQAFYVGALGSRRTHARRVAALRELGVTETAIRRIRAPIGLDIGAKSPPEIALAILAEVIDAAQGAETAWSALVPDAKARIPLGRA